MEEEIEKALNNLWNSLDDEIFNLTYSQEQMQEDIRLILNRYNYLDSKNENLINKYKEQKKEIQGNHILLAKYSKKIEEQQQVIELMAKDIAEHKLGEDICRQVKEPKKEECYAYMYDANACSDCVIEYYKKKAKGE